MFRAPVALIAERTPGLNIDKGGAAAERCIFQICDSLFGKSRWQSMQVASAPKMLCNNQGGHYVDFRYLVVDVTDEETYRGYVPEDARADYCRKVHAKYMIEEEASGHTKRLPLKMGS